MSGAVLLVDDEDLALDALMTILAPWAEKRGVELLAAHSAPEALEVMAAHGDSVAVVLSDLRMPGMMGSDLLLEIRRRYPQVVAMLATGAPEIGEIAKAVTAGIFSFILKPWRLDYLESELDKALRFYRLQEENRRYLAMLEEELRWGGSLQRALLRIIPPEDAAFAFEASYVPLEQLHCGGDFYDLLAGADGSYLCLIGDVAGHGIRAALVTAALKAMITAQYAPSRTRLSPAGLLFWLNERICDLLPELPDLFVTSAACLLEPDPPRLLYASAGHLPAYIVGGGEAEALRVSGATLGFERGASYREEGFALAPGDRVVLYTDGLVEVARGRAAIGEERFREVLLGAAAEEDFHTALIEGMRAFTEDGRFIDDVAVLSARVKARPT